MKYLIPFIIVFSTFAGVGGIGGGSRGFQKGGHINFQKDSTFVNVLYSRTLCHDGHDFKATVIKCTVRSNDDDRKCLEREKVKIYQPLESTRLRCHKFDDDTCVEWIEVPLNQSPKRIVEIKDRDDNVVDMKKVIIPTCP